MRRRSRASSKLANARSRKAKTAKAVRRSSSSVAGRETEVARLRRERDEALERETATAEVLKVISSSPGELEPVFQAMLANATRICEAKFGILYRCEGDALRTIAMHDAPKPFVEARRKNPIIRPNPDTTLGRAMATKQPVQIADILEELDPLDARAAQLPKLAGARTVLAVPMLKENELVGAFLIYRTEVRPFADKQIALVENFAAQAVIAIENTRLLNELRQRTAELTESLDQQTATSEVLGVISSSPGELEIVFRSMLENAVRICQARFGFMLRYDGDAYHAVAELCDEPAYVEEMRRGPLRPHPESALGSVARTRQVAQIADITAHRLYVERNPIFVAGAELGGMRTIVAVPMLKDQQLIGAITIFRQEVRPFTDKQIALVQNFAAQAVIAIENARLLNELRQRTDDLSQRTDDLTEALEQQTATSEVLRVISSSPGELEPVFQTMLGNAVRICDAQFGISFIADGNNYRIAAGHNLPSAFVEERQRTPLVSMSGNTALARVARTKAPVQISDVANDPAYRPDPQRRSFVTLTGARTVICVPMLKDNELVGAMAVYRHEVRPFTDKQIALVQNFAAQAVTAIENTRLLNELRQSLQQQTATADVLKVISRSTFDLQTVLDTLVESVTRLCGADHAWLFQRDGEIFRWVASYGHATEVHARLRAYFKDREVPVDRGSITGRAALEARVVQVSDVLADPDYTWSEARKIGGYRAALGAPLLRKGEVVGVIFVNKIVAELFTAKQIELVQTFADQAVIAIENTRLLNELRQRTDDLTESLEQQTATSEILASMSGSMTDTKPVFDAIVRNLLRLFPTSFAVVQLLQGGMIHMAALDGEPGFEKLAARYPLPLDDRTIAGRAMLSKQVVQFAPLLGNPATPPASAQFAREFGLYNSMISAPMIRGDKVIGAIATARRDPQEFDSKQVALIKSFRRSGGDCHRECSPV
jgi:GAF domain-containing protein